VKALLLSFAILLLCGPLSATETSPLLVTHGSRKLPRVALTFDLCQVPSKPSGFDRGVIAVLQQTATPATFFVGGDWLRTHPQEGGELAAEPLFVLGDHSWSHPDLRRLDDAAIRAEIERSEELLMERFGTTPRLFRLPFGTYDDRVLQAAAATGVRIIQWDVVSGDPDRKLSRERLVRNVTTGVHNGSIVIMHANGRGWQTAAALPEIIRTLRERGFELVTVTTLLAPGNG
jgi:peptidoglycan-N-acetylglucosamine deacetylase